MKNNVFLSLFILLIGFEGFSQRYNADANYGGNYGGGFFSRFYKLKMGFRFSPGIMINYVEASKNFKGFESNGANVRLSLGPIADFYITDKYAFSTGLWYTVKSVNYSMHGTFYDNELFKTTPLTADEIRGTEANFNLQYLQLPLTMKIFSDNILDDTPVYLQFGGTVDIKIAEKALDKTRNALFQYQERLASSQSIFSFGDVGLLLGIGGEKSISRGGDAFFFGLQYQRGFVEINRSRTFGDLITKNGAFYLDFGVKF
ncbi:hypothetical protein VB796_11425 [Arcicella sp. LKC2W]|uniref:hypothetical protein n=1 Tax=Arcicella sp. LKC2W TaxID=2984198 RepID=UPI002B1FC961|nr:hypothetical protein [Arcicella sp. LKC2W]MEA5459656.1 hypothetical protein [Arcicella sp. LKC2W]